MEEEDGAASAASSCVSVRSDGVTQTPPHYSHGPAVTIGRKRKRSGVCEEEQLSCCALCQDVLKDPVSTSCGHWFCRQCISSYWDQSASSGDSSCPQCGERSRSRAGLQTASQSSCVQTDVGLQEVLDEHKISLRRRCERVTEGSDETGSRSLLNRIYTELYITEGQSEEVHTQHEVRQLETASKMDALHDTPIRCQDIFKALPDQQRAIRVVLTNGVAGVGKTFSVQKFTLDWAEGLENQHVSVVVLLSFRELNLIRDEQYSLLQLLHVFHPTLQKVTAEKLAVSQLLFIFDGLDESRLSLDFTNRKLLSDVTQKSSVSQLLTNLIQGNLLPSALVWIASRPAAANQIPPTCVDRLTEVRGFSDAQKEEYFRRRFSDEELSSRIISQCGLDVTEASVYSGVCTEIFKRECVIFQKPVYCFVHLSIQEFLAAVYMFHCFTSRKTEVLRDFLGRKHIRLINCEFSETHCEVVASALKSNPSHLTELDMSFNKLQDSAVKVLCAGLESPNCRLETLSLKDCGLSDISWAYLAAALKSNPLYPRVLDLSGNYCNLQDSGVKQLCVLLENPRCRFETLRLSFCDLSTISCDYLAAVLKLNPSYPREVNLSINNLQDSGVTQLCVLLENPRYQFETLRLKECGLSEISCDYLAAALKSNPSHLRQLDLTSNDLQDSGVKRLCGFLESPVCGLETLSLMDCGLSKISCDYLAAALKSNPSHLRQLDLQYNNLKDPDVKQLSDLQQSPDCRLETMWWR
ncbi:unnamed protein product [Oreochromis niloticus]|nr:unnamed protein product [Mustela putorius furo]